MVWQAFGQATVGTEGTTPVTVFFAVGDQGRVLMELLQHGFKQGVAEIVHPGLRNWLAIWRGGRASLLGDLLHAWVVFVSQQGFGFALGVVAWHDLVRQHQFADALGIDVW